MTRIFDAPCALVFEAYTNPDMIAQWWGWRHLTTIVDEMDVWPGGVWGYVQRDVDGTEFAFNGTYREIVPPERLVATFEFEGMPGHIVLNTTTLDEVDGKTRLTTRSLFQTPEDRDGMLESGMEEGASETWERLVELLLSRDHRKSC